MVTKVRVVGRLKNKVRFNFWLLCSLDDELNKVCDITGQTKVEAITEALRYWLNAQYKMGVK